MRAILYVIIVQELSSRGWHKKTSEHRNSFIGCSVLLFKLTPVVFGLLLCVVECSGEEQCKWLSNSVSGCQMTHRYWRAFDKMVAFLEGLKHQIFLFYYK